MIDYRYHALSLVAVIFALALGVLLGVAIGDSNLVSSAKSGIVHNLSGEVQDARSQSADLQAQLGQEQAFAGALYPLAVHTTLGGRNIGVAFLGEPSDQVNALARNVVAQAGGSVATVVAVQEPLDLAGLARAAAGTHYAGLASSPALLERFGAIIGHELVSGGPLLGRALLSRVRPILLSAFDGQLGRLQGLIVMRAEPRGMNAAQTEAAAAFEKGLLAGVSAAGVPAVGVELTGTRPSQVPWYEGMRITSVDDLDTPAGAVALAYGLAGYQGAFGVKPTADSLLPSPTGAAPTP